MFPQRSAFGAVCAEIERVVERRLLAGLWLRKRRGAPIYDLPPSVNRRVIAGLQMGFLAVILASVNIFGGFIVTQRMLSMFKKKK